MRNEVVVGTRRKKFTIRVYLFGDEEHGIKRRCAKIIDNSYGHGDGAMDVSV